MHNPRKNRSLVPHSEVIRLYLSKEPTTKISKVAGISVAGVFRILKFNKVKLRTKEESEFLKRRFDYKAMMSDYKNGMFLRDVAKKHNADASHILKIIKDNGIQSRGREGGIGPDNYRWKDGITYDKDGYIIKNERGKQTKYHRFLLQEALGKKLLPIEATHHIDGNKSNNDLENLAIMHKNEHNRFDTFLKFVGLKQNKRNLEKFCRKGKSRFAWLFTKKDYSNACKNYKPHNPYIKRKVKTLCLYGGCDVVSFTIAKLCSKHYQRTVAEKRGYWKSGGGKISTFKGLYKKEKNKVVV